MFNYFDSTGATYWVGTRGFRVSPSRLGCLTKCSRLSGILCATLLSDALAGISSTNSFSDSFSTSWADVWDQSCMVKHWYVDFHQYWVSTITGLYKYSCTAVQIFSQVGYHLGSLDPWPWFEWESSRLGIPRRENIYQWKAKVNPNGGDTRSSTRPI